MWSSPQHPAAHGVLRLILELNGEEVLRADPVRITIASISSTCPCTYLYSYFSTLVSCIEVLRS